MEPIGLQSIASSQSEKPLTTSVIVEKIENGYLVYPSSSYVQNYKRVFANELSEFPGIIANMFGLHDDISNS